MLADQLYFRPWADPISRSRRKGNAHGLIQFIAKRFLHCDKLPA